MTIDEAITELEKEVECWLFNPEAEVLKALKLGMEALKRIEEARILGEAYAGYKLPGETP